MRNNFNYILQVTAICSSLCGLVHAENSEPTHKDQMAIIEQCAQANLLSHFPEMFVEETLVEFKVPEENRKAIISELNSKEGEVIRRVEEKAYESRSDFLKDPEKRALALQMFRQALGETFSEVLNAHGIHDKTVIENMLKDLQQRKAQAFTRCLEGAKTK